LAEFPTTGITYDVTPVPPSYYERYHSLLNRALFYSVANPEYGADPSGVSLSRTAIQNCWTAAPAYSTIWYPPSSSGRATYRIDSTLSHPVKPLFHYAPPGGAVIKNDGTGEVLDVAAGTNDWAIDGLVLDGNYPTRTTGRALVVTGCTRFHLRNVRFQNFGEMCLTVRSSSWWSVTHCTFDTFYRSGVYLAEGTGAAVEDFEVGHNHFLNTNLSNSAGHSAIQANNQAPGSAALMAVRRGHIHHNQLTISQGVGIGLDLITDSLIEENDLRGTPTGECVAISGARNRIRGGSYGGTSVGSAGLLLFCWAGNDQTNEDTTVQGVYLPGPGTTTQGIAIVPAANSVTVRRILVHGCRAHAWNYGIQAYNNGRTGFADDGTVYIRDNHLTNNNTGGHTFADITPVLRGNLTAADTIDAP
jgi:hypothetical protein